MNYSVTDINARLWLVRIGRWLDRQALYRVVAAGLSLGLSLAIPGFLLLPEPGWMVLWLALFVGLGCLGFSAMPVFEEISPIIAKPFRVQDGDRIAIMMMDLPGGTFIMGSPDSDDWAIDNEKPQHKVTVSGFRIGLTPITVKQYSEVIGRELPTENKAQLPITNMSWYEAIQFCNQLSERNGFQRCYYQRFGRWRCDWKADGYRLPTEAEWEFACRAGNTSRYYFGDDSKDLDRYAWYEKNTAYTLKVPVQVYVKYVKSVKSACPSTFTFTFVKSACPSTLNTLKVPVQVALLPHCRTAVKLA